MKINLSGVYRSGEMKKWLKIVPVVLAFTLIFMTMPGGALSPQAAEASAGWYNTEWAYRKKITIQSSQVVADLNNFPVLISITNDTDLRDHASETDGSDIIFTEDDGTTLLKREIEKWDDGNKKAWLWVKVPSVASGADTELYLYYDKDHAENTAKVGDTNDAIAENVWDTNFKAVYHMRNGVVNAEKLEKIGIKNKDDCG